MSYARPRRAVLTLADVAQKAGVSIATASRVLSDGERRPHEQLRRRVLDAAEELGYAVNGPARTVSTGRSNVIGLVVPDIADPYFSTIAAGVLHAAEVHGCVTTISDTRGSPLREIECLTRLRQMRAGAVVLTGRRMRNDATERALENQIRLHAQSGGRVVCIGQQVAHCDAVVIDDRASAHCLAEHLVALGYRAFVVLSGSLQIRTAAERLAGLRTALARHGLRLGHRNVFVTGFDQDAGRAGADAFLRSGVRADCIIAVNDLVAIGAIAALRSCAVRVPQDIAVSGYGDIAVLEGVEPALTTVRIPLYEIGVEAIRHALSAPAANGAPRTTAFHGKVVVRASTPSRL